LEQKSTYTNIEFSNWGTEVQGTDAQRLVQASEKWKTKMKRKVKHPISVLGLPLDSLTATGAVEAIEDLIHSGGTHQIATANLDFWMNSLSDRHLHRIIAGCSLVLPDGMPLVWVSKLLGCPLAERVTGVDLVPRLAELSVRKGYGIFLLGGKGDVAERARKLLEEKFPGVRIVGTFAPTEEEMAQLDHSEILRRIHVAKPEILLVALGNPKQEKWIWLHRKRLGVPVAMGVGGSFEMLVGDMRRAPRWIQKCGLEWAMRFVQEPARLGPRYLRDFIALGRKLPTTLLAAWMQRPFLGESHLATVSTPLVMHVYLHGKLGAQVADDLMNAADASIANGLVMVVHLQSVKQITASGLGLLMDVRRRVLDAGLTLSLAGLNFRQRFLLHAWCAQPLFDEWESSGGHTSSIAKDVQTNAGMDLQGD
jgi:N-acetylglucosaminyldiphosphoundecaprenol N-acetyl-beta-D-mannosaminyltransferase